VPDNMVAAPVPTGNQIPGGSVDAMFRPHEASPGRIEFSETTAYFLVESPAASGKPHVHQFVDWLLDEINRDSERDEPR
jgi:hypothetical protein